MRSRYMMLNTRVPGINGDGSNRQGWRTNPLISFGISVLTTDRVLSPEAPSELFRDWQRTRTQSSATADTARGGKWMSSSAKSGNHRREAHRRVANLPAAQPTFKILV